VTGLVLCMRATVHDTVGRISSLAWRTLTEKTTVAFEREGSGAIRPRPRSGDMPVAGSLRRAELHALGRVGFRCGQVIRIACMCAHETVGCARVRYRLLARACG